MHLIDLNRFDKKPHHSAAALLGRQTNRVEVDSLLKYNIRFRICGPPLGKLIIVNHHHGSNWKGITYVEVHISLRMG
jgi:hypothetical protein